MTAPLALRQLSAAILKETRLILRDPHALAVLFIVPVVFVTILSLALRDVFKSHTGIAFRTLIVNHDTGAVGKSLQDAFSGESHFRVDVAPKSAPNTAALKALANSGEYRLVLVIPPRATPQVRARASEQMNLNGGSGKTEPVSATVYLDPALRPEHRNMVLAIANGIFSTIEARLMAERVLELARTPFGKPTLSADKLAAPKLFTKLDESDAVEHLPAPTSVQQNAPGWTLLAMFFLAIPLSVTFIREQALGGLLRLQTMPVRGWVLFGGKIVPYFLINQIQFALILIVGVWGLPLLGGDRLTLGNSPAALVALAVSASVAAIGFALLIATIARTSEQASTLSATLIMTLAAIGGVMVPTIIMPPFMQQLAEFSPFFWGLEGFLDVYVRGGGLREVWPECAKLAAFAVLCFVLALRRFHQRAHAS